MNKVVIDMSMSLDGFVAGPDDGRADRWVATGARTSSTGTSRARRSTAIPSSGPSQAPTATSGAHVRRERRVHLRAADH